MAEIVRRLAPLVVQRLVAQASNSLLDNCSDVSLA